MLPKIAGSPISTQASFDFLRATKSQVLKEVKHRKSKPFKNADKKL